MPKKKSITAKEKFKKTCPDCRTAAEWGFKGYCGACYQWRRRHPGRTRKRGTWHKNCAVCRTRRLLQKEQKKWLTVSAMARKLGLREATVLGLHIAIAKDRLPERSLALRRFRKAVEDAKKRARPR
jgi:uncharacterized Fe-S cluster-containing radical SAM superfamily protein